MTVRIFVLLGGLAGPDGEADSRGMLALAERLRPFGSVSTHFWSSFTDVAQVIKQLPEGTKVIVIGYSGGGSRATWITCMVYPQEIALLVCYDPSPRWQMMVLRKNVSRAVSYHNRTPLMLGLGGGIVTGPEADHIQNIDIAEQHLVVDYDESLHLRTIAEVRQVAEGAQ